MFDPESGEGLQLLLREFGVVAEVIDRPIYVGSYIGTRGITSPLNVWIRVQYFEPWEQARNTFIRGYTSHTYAYKTTPLITKAFVQSLCEWSRAAGTRQIIEWVTRSTRERIDVSLYGNIVEQEIIQSITQPTHITE